MSLRLFVGPLLLPPGQDVELPAGAARHLQVRRAQPGDAVELFDGQGRAWRAEVRAMGRQSVLVRRGEPVAVMPELPVALTLAVGMPANERMDGLVEKATELGVAAIQPLVTARGVLRLSGERAERRQAHWQGIAAAACEQCGRSTVPLIHGVQSLAEWLAQAGPPSEDTARWLLCPPGGSSVAEARARAGAARRVTVLSGPEGGLAPEEEAAARGAGFVPVQLGPRVLRADTAPLAVLAWWSLQT